MEVSGKYHDLNSLTAEEHRWLNRRLDGTQSQSRRFGEEKHFLAVPGCEPRSIHITNMHMYAHHYNHM